MLSIAPIAGGGSAYYIANTQEKSGYYLDGEKASYWGGGAKDALALPDGPVKAEDFDRIFDGYTPNGERIGNPNKEGGWNHNPGRDLTFSAPKSISILAQGPLRPEILKIHKAAIATAMKYAEKHFAETRISGKIVGDQKTVWAVVNEETSRENDPGLHGHVVNFNMVQGEDGKFRAMHNPKIYENSILLGQIYRAEIAKGIKGLGFETEPVGRHGQWEVKSVPKEVREVFSKRRQAIVAKIDPANDNAKRRERISILTRPAKKIISRSDLLQKWDAELAKLKTSFRALSQPKNNQRQPDQLSAKDALKSTLKSVSETQSFIGKYALLREVMDRTHGNLTIDKIESAIEKQLKSETLVLSKCGQHYKTAQTLEREWSVVRELQRGHLKSGPLVSEDKLNAVLDKSILTDGQKAASRLIALDVSGIVKIQGVAGSGKTTALRTAMPLIKENGYKVIGISGTAESTRQLTKTGVFDKTMTLQRYLLVPEGDKKTVLVVDEGSLIGTKQMQDLLRYTNSRKLPRIVFMGDENQMEGVQAGTPFKDMEKAGVRSVTLDEVMRQKDVRHRKGVKELSEAKPRAAFETLKPEIQEVSKDKLIDYTIEAWQKTGNEKTPIIIQTNRQKSEINNAIKAGRLKSAKDLKGTTLKTWQPIHKSNEEKRFASTYTDASHIRFNREYERYGIKRGDIFKLELINKDRNEVVLSKNGRQKIFNPAKYKMGDGAVELYRQEDRELHEGDRIRFTRGGTKRPVNNNDYGTVRKIGKNNIEFSLDRGKSITLDQKEPTIRHIDHAWASTTHAYQGKTVDHAIVLMPSHKSPLTTLNSLYTGSSRHRLSLTIVTDDAKQLQHNIERSLEVKKLDAKISWPERETKNAAAKDREIQSRQEHERVPIRLPQRSDHSR